MILRSGNSFNTSRLSSGTKAGAEIAKVLASLLRGRSTFYYCDETFSYIHSDIEKAVLPLMMDLIRPGKVQKQSLPCTEVPFAYLQAAFFMFRAFFLLANAAFRKGRKAPSDDLPLKDFLHKWPGFKSREVCSRTTEPYYTAERLHIA